MLWTCQRGDVRATFGLAVRTIMLKSVNQEVKGKLKTVLSATLIAILIVSFASLPSLHAQSDNSSGKIRFIANTTDGSKLKGFEARGCDVRYVFTSSSALDCPPGIGKALGLQEDIKVFAMDAAANTQIGADLVHTAGYDGSGIKVAALDTGIDYTHPELSSSYVGGKDFVNSDDDPRDDEGHGTFVAGLITADGLTANAKGTAPAAGIWAGKVLNSAGSGYFSDVAAAINHVADNNLANIIIMSLGTRPPYTYKGSNCDGVVPYVDAAIDNALSKGISVVAAAGNSGGSGISIPGCISGVDTIGAVDINDVRAPFSGKGRSLDVMGLGVGDYSTRMGGGYGTGSGTSFSTPIVAAVIALMKQKDPTLTPTQITNTLRSTAVDLGPAGFDTDYGYGRVNAYDALGLSETIEGDTPDTTAPTISNVQATGVTDSGATITWNTDEPSDSVVRYGISADNLSTTVSGSALVTSHSVALTGLSASTTYYYEVQSTDGSSNTAVSSVQGFTTTAAPSGGALAANVSTDNTSYQMGSFVYITVQVTDGTNPISGAAVHVDIVTPTGRTYAGDGSTGSDGQVIFKFKAKNPDGKGTYNVTATANKAGFTAGSGSTTFDIV